MSLGFTRKYKPKRTYYKTYLEKDIVDQVLKTFDEDPTCPLVKISEESGIPYKTIQYWRRRYNEDHNYKPGDLLGQHRRHFTLDEERKVVSFIRTQYINYCIMIKSKHLKKLYFLVGNH